MKYVININIIVYLPKNQSDESSCILMIEFAIKKVSILSR